jgi:hypothetical protein
MTYTHSRCVSNRLQRGIGPQFISGIWTRAVTTLQAIRGATHKMLNSFIDRDGIPIFIRLGCMAVLLLPCVQ